MKQYVKSNVQRGKSKEETTQKKPFDKKKYRLQKYSNKHKVNQWEERRKKAIVRDFYKQVNKDQLKTAQKSPNKNSDSKDDARPPKRKFSTFDIAKRELQRKKEEAAKKKEEALRIKAEKEEALKKYKEKKLKTFKKLSQKTKKGQPVMKGRLELLLERIEQEVGKS